MQKFFRMPGRGIYDTGLVFVCAYTGNISGSKTVNGLLIFHLAQRSHLFETVEKFFYRMTILSAFPVMIGTTAYREGEEEMLSFQSIPGRAVRLSLIHI